MRDHYDVDKMKWKKNPFAAILQAQDATTRKNPDPSLRITLNQRRALIALIQVHDKDGTAQGVSSSSVHRYLLAKAEPSVSRTTWHALATKGFIETSVSTNGVLLIKPTDLGRSFAK